MRCPTNKHVFSAGLLIAAVALTFGVANALGQQLMTIPTLSGDTANEGRAITSDGQYVVGFSGISGIRGFLYPVGAGSSTYVISSDGAPAGLATGVGYRTSGGHTELIIAGVSGPYVTEWMTTDGGTSFGAKRWNTSFTYSTMPAANALGSKTGSDAYYVTSSKNAANQPVYLNQGSGPWVATMTYSSMGITGGDVAYMSGVGASGRAVGWRGAASKNVLMTYNGSATPANSFFNGLAGDQYGQAYSVSADGNTVFGLSSTAAGGVGPKTGYKTTFSGATPNGTVQGPVNALPLLGGESGASHQVPYGCTADGRYAVGMDYPGVERAVLWDTGDANPANWTVTDLTTFATSHGILDGWVRLSRGYSVGEDGVGDPVVTGIGVWSPDGGTTTFTRGFVMVIPEPATISLLTLGLFGLLGFRRRK